MGILFLLLMADHYTGNALHEWMGITVAGAFLLHTWLNRNWYRALAKGRYNFSRTLQVLLNMLLLMAAMGTLITAVLISRTVFLFLGFKGELFVRTVHVCCAHWLFLLSAAHLGIYGKRLKEELGLSVSFLRSYMVERVSLVFYAVLAAYGAYAFSSRELIYPLTMNSAFMLWNENDPLFFFLFDYGAVFVLCAWASWILFHCVVRKSRSREIR
ncbi:MAG: hypothetical protein ACI4P0_06200 [Mailhella sp.]